MLSPAAVCLSLLSFRLVFYAIINELGDSSKNIGHAAQITAQTRSPNPQPKPTAQTRSPNTQPESTAHTRSPNPQPEP